jgi:flagellar hook-associated protein 2
MPITFSGLSSGLDTNSIITDLVRFSQQRIDSLRTKQQEANARQDLLTTLKSRLRSLQDRASSLARPHRNVFDRRAAASSDTSLVTAAAGSLATPGVHSLRVLRLATAQQLASQGFDDLNSPITTGTFQIRSGQSSATITIDSTNNTLAGLAQAINNANVGVTATVINDGSDWRTQPYRLLLTAINTGADNAIEITNNLSPEGGGAFRPNFDSTHIGPAVVADNFSGTSVITSNTGAGGYTGMNNDTFTFTIQNSGTVGIDSDIQVAYTNSSGTRTGTLTLSAADAGVAKSVVDGIQVTFGSGTLMAGETFSVDVFTPTLQEAANAQIQLGSGPAAITVQSAKNQITDLIRGVTLNLQAADPSKEVRLTITNDTSAAKQEILDFVKDYNDFINELAKQTKFDAATGIAAPLAGNRSVLALRDQLQQALLATTGNLSTSVNRLTALGISLDEKGRLSVNEARLNDILEGRVTGVTFSDVRKLFALRGESSQPAIEFVTGSGQTKNSTTPYQVEITQAAEQASITADAALPNSIVLDGTNNQLTIRIDDTTSSVLTLTEGTYTPLQLARELQSRINGAFATSGRSVTVSLSSQRLVVTSDRFGAASEVTLVSGSALSTLGFLGNESDRGQDVAGSFIVDGVVETATGVGRILTGASSNANTADLAVQVSLTASQLHGGAEGTITITHGLASQLNRMLENILSPQSGRLAAIANRFRQNAEEAAAAVLAETQALDERRAALVRQFANMEQTLSRLKSAGEFASNTLLLLASPRSSSR